MTPSPRGPRVIFFLSSLTFSQYLFSSLLTHFLTISIFHPISPFVNIYFLILSPHLPISIFHSLSPFVNIKFFTLGLAVPIINPHFCTCAARSTAAGFVPQVFGQQVFGQQDHGSSCASRSRPAGFWPAGPRPANLIL